MMSSSSSSSSVIARTGRQRQLYENEYRLVAGCIPFRFKTLVEDPAAYLENRLQVLMISSPGRDDLVFPKGGWENDETVEEAACREALEEAGVRGILSKDRLGVWEFRSKSRQNSCSLEGICRGYMFSLEVTEELDSWPEEDNHGRIWLSIEEAFRRSRYDWMRGALERFLIVMSETLECQRESQMRGDLVAPVTELLPEHKILIPSCFEKPSVTQRIDERLFVLG
ncbi:hypothetical protein Syun_024651 [Stephania yunnanensis]|uniref:Nudix hydrolase domain-containing protein n=1 Tax=Stephania yunnanensis TaxID=152371 RepID=A0AAP0NJF9_9MAGN